MTDEPRTYGYKELADRIAAVLGEHPSLSSLRAARAAQSRRIAESHLRPSVTAGMPRPLPADSRTAAARFSAEAVEAWLSGHPRTQWDRAERDARERLAADEDVEQVVDGALRAGLSWSVITQLLNEHAVVTGGRTMSKAGVHKKYRRLELGPQ